MDSHNVEGYFRQHRKTLAVIFMAVGMLAVSGFFMGMRQTELHGSGVRGADSGNDNASISANLPSAPRYGDIPTTEWKANRNWNFTLTDLPRVLEPPATAAAPDAEELSAAIARRASLRAYDGAPPVVPHAIDTISSAACTECHGQGENLLIGGKRPAEISHPWITNCTSCHVPADGLRRFTEPAESRLVVTSSFAGEPSAGKGTRAYQGAPPTMSHPVWMRQNCMACHGPGRESAIRSSHPERQNCLQCHAENAAFDNRESYLTNTPPPVLSPKSQK